MRFGIIALAALVAGCFVGCGGGKTGPTVAYVTNGIADFWVIGAKGATDAGEKFGVNVEVRMPPNGPEDQKRMVQELLAKGVQGIAISPISPATQADLLDEIAAHTKLVTQDSDAPNSKRLVYIGMDNYLAGRLCGELVKEAIPQGGKVMIFVGRIDQDNARLRRQGVIDELLDRSKDSTRYDQPGQELKSEKYTIVDTRTDGFDFAKAKAEAQDAISRYPDLNCMVGLFAYNTPKLVEAVKEAGKKDQIKICGFDEDAGTLQGIHDGLVYGTTVQSPYKYGYESVRVLAALIKGDNSVIPASGFIDIPAKKIIKSNVAEFEAELKTMIGDKSTAPAATAEATPATTTPAAAAPVDATPGPAEGAAPAAP